MRIYRGLFVVLAVFSLLFASAVKDVLLAACTPPAKIVGSAYSPTSIQDAYDYASQTSGPAYFTLKLAGEIFSEDLFIDKGAVILDGGYDCTFTNKTAIPTSLFGTLSISTGAISFAGDVSIVSTDQCAFDIDLDGYDVGHCAPGPVDCNDKALNINPGATEICDGIDNNCDGQIDEGAIPTDADGDGYYAIGSCGASPYTDDCNDNDATVHPSALDIPYDGIDQDCNGADLTFIGENCVWCHLNPPTWPGLHAAVAPPDASCAGCHAPFVSNILPGHYRQTVLTADNGMATGSTIVCVSCHDASVANHYIPLGNGSELVWGKVVNDRPAVNCDTCHENRATAHETAAAHNNRMILAECGTCHTSDPSLLGSPGTGTLADAADVDSLHHADCDLCHNYTGTLLNAAIVRQVIAQGVGGSAVSCLDCHPAHGEHTVAVGPGDLSYYAPGQPCSDCHVVSTWAEIEGVEHNVPTNGESSCATCHHSPRQEVIDAISLGADPTRCLTCHAEKELAPHGEHDHSANITGSADCIACHAHSDPQIVEVIHNNSCATCHNSLRPEIRVVINSGQAECIDCHPTHNGPSAHNNLAAPARCAICHTDKITGTDFNYIINNHGPLAYLENTELDSCQRCHNSTVPEVVSTINEGKGTAGVPVTCANCHTSQHVPIVTPVKIHDYILTGTSSTCSICHIENNWSHTDMNATASCATCHVSANQDEFNALHQNDCRLCHLSQRNEVIAAIYAGIAGASVECIGCHIPYGTDFFTGHQNPDHSNLVTTSGTGCADCHSEPPPLIDPADNKVHNECTSCHATNGVLISFAIGKSAPGNCTSCHTSSWEATHTTAPDHTALVTVGGTGCASCHSDPPPLIDGVDPQVHNACSSCHDATTGILISLAANKTFAAGGNCTTCHTANWRQLHPGQPDHSGIVTVSGTSCGSCHDNTLVSGAATTHNGCSTCHDGQTGALISLAEGKSAPGNCTSCHGSSWEAIHTTAPDHTTLVTVTGSSCGTCHGDPPPLIDPANPLNHDACSNCHNATSGALISLATGKTFTAGGNCVTCHGDGDNTHHGTSFSQSGDCFHCHTSLAVDRPAQAACRECHGTNMHNKGGPIQDYAACAACHNQAPYHAKPNGPLGYNRLTNNGKQTGKGRFAIFWAQWTNNGRDSEIVENSRPNGEDMNDEGGQNWRNPSLNFDMYSIDHEGQLYQVPGFSPPTQGSGTPAVGANLTLNKTASASGDYGSSYRAANAVDGNDSSYWYQQSSNDEWLKVDLGQSQNISKVTIKWHSSEYAEEYQVQVSTDNYTWTRVLDARNGNGGTDTATFSSRSARYVRILCTRVHNNGYAIYELEVFQQ